MSEISQDTKYRAASKQASERIKCRYNHGTPGMYIDQQCKENDDFGNGNKELHRRNYKQSVLDSAVCRATKIHVCGIRNLIL